MHSLDDLGWDPFFDEQVTSDERTRWTPARVVWQGRGYRISTGAAEWQAQVSGRLRHATATPAGLPAVGDWVLASVRPDEGHATIHRQLTRRTRFSRASAGRSAEEQVVAANVDTVLLVTSCNLDFNLRRIERYLALAWESGARPVVVLNKADLSTEHAGWHSAIAPVTQGVPTILTSAHSGEGVTELRDIVRVGGTTALLGSSGVGKSTLVNALTGTSAGDRPQRALPVRDGDDRGRHSTTARQLFCVPGGGVLIDTPGMRELQLWDADTGIEHAFADVEALASNCRFRDCSHSREPGCAIVDAVDRGELSTERLDHYQRLQREDTYLRSRHDESARSERTRRAKAISKAVRLQYKLRRR